MVRPAYTILPQGGPEGSCSWIADRSGLRNTSMRVFPELPAHVARHRTHNRKRERKSAALGDHLFSFAR